ncbi:MAG: DUF134 domain-containing protein [Candidatus Diapherotrites archaeon]|nr:DUF134 domain-containing protein [Candidatus Diapherotrites archaeon]
MPRPKIPRFISGLPEADFFLPKGIAPSKIPEVTLSVDEIEAIKLKDLLGLEQEECAKRMNISRGTFQRILNSARKKIADALVNGKAIRIEGGVYEMVSQQQAGFGRGRGVGFGRGLRPSYCVCPVCGNRQPKLPGVGCRQMKCEKCGALMVRGD